MCLHIYLYRNRNTKGRRLNVVELAFNCGAFKIKAEIWENHSLNLARIFANVFSALLARQ